MRLGLLRRFRPHRATGSAPWHYVLGPIGAALLGQENRDEKRWLPQVRADRQLALERSQRLGHMTGASWFFVALARHAREHGGGELLQWDSEGQASDYLYATAANSARALTGSASGRKTAATQAAAVARIAARLDARNGQKPAA